MKKSFIILMLLCTVSAIQAQLKLESGLLIGAGKGSISHELYPDFAKFMKYGDLKNKADLSLGYRFRLKPVNSRFFYDMDINAGVKLWGYDETYSRKNATNEWTVEPGGSDCTYIYGSLAATANYRLYKGLSVGAGMQPRYYFFQSGDKAKSPAIDVPIVAKLAYNFRFIEVGFTYKFGVFNTLKEIGGMKSLKFNDWQISVYIPF